MLNKGIIFISKSSKNLIKFDKTFSYINYEGKKLILQNKLKHEALKFTNDTDKRHNLNYSNLNVRINNIEISETTNIIIPATDGAYGTSFRLKISLHNKLLIPLSPNFYKLALILPENLSFEGIFDEFTPVKFSEAYSLFYFNINEFIVPNEWWYWEREFTDYTPTDYTKILQSPLKIGFRLLTESGEHDRFFLIQPNIIERRSGI